MKSEAMRSKVEKLIQDDTIVMFTTTTCPFCVKAKSALQNAKIDFTSYELNLLPDGQEIRDMLYEMTNRTSVPSICTYSNEIHREVYDVYASLINCILINHTHHVNVHAMLFLCVSVP